MTKVILQLIINQSCFLLIEMNRMYDACVGCYSAGVEHYNEVKNISICEFLPPHLVIYVDLPAEEVQKNLKASGKVCVGIRLYVVPNN